MVQWLGFDAFTAVAVKAVQTLVRELRSCKPCVCAPAKLLQPCLTLCDPLSMGFSRQEYWSGLPCPPAGSLPNPGIELESYMPPA